MKAFLIVTGLLFGLMAAVHVWRAIAEWTPSTGYVTGMAALIIIPAAFSAWAFCLLRKLSDNGAKSGKGE
jgi:hypothetical protein